MRILRDEAAIAELPADNLRRLIEKRVAEINECCPWDVAGNGLITMPVKGKPISISSREPTPIRGWFENFLADAYLGGRNECYWFGPTPVTDDHRLSKRPSATRSAIGRSCARTGKTRATSSYGASRSLNSIRLGIAKAASCP